MVKPGAALAARLEALLARHWWQPRPTWLARSLQPLAAVYGRLVAQRQGRWPAQALRVPVLVVGNLVLGGAGKTPAVMALVQAFQSAGRRPGVVSRGHGRSGSTVREVRPADEAGLVGDEPLLIVRRTGVPVWVGQDRAAAARALCKQHPEVDVLISDDGLQHLGLSRQAELLVFDDRGIGNGLLLPAGPLRQPMLQRLDLRQRVLYTGNRQSTPLPGPKGTRSLSKAWPLDAWLHGDGSARVDLVKLSELGVDRPVAAAGLGEPEKFFRMVEAAGMQIDRLPLPDHHAYATLPWPADMRDVLTTEKDAVKIDPERLGHTRVWVLPLDFQLPEGLATDLLSLLPAPEPEKPPP